MTDSPAPVTVKQCRAPFSADLLDQIASVKACAYAEIGLRPWDAREINAIANLESSKLWVATSENDAIIGFLLASLMQGEGEILALGIHPAHRRQKIGHRLVNEIFRCALSAKVEKLILEVAVINYSAIAFYEILRFREVGIRRDYYRIEGSRVDAKIMEKRFN